LYSPLQVRGIGEREAGGVKPHPYRTCDIYQGWIPDQVRTIDERSNEWRSMRGKRKSYLLRIDEGLWNEINEWAGQEFRSVNNQIELLLQRAVEERIKHRRENS
jgi:hypothetical protein